MSLQDDIFDIQDALKGKPELKTFKKVMKFYSAMEAEHDNNLKILDAVSTGIRALKYIEQIDGHKSRAALRL